MSSKRTMYKCRYGGCGMKFKTAEGRKIHEDNMHGPWITPTYGTKSQIFDLSHFCTWNQSVTHQLNVIMDQHDADSVFNLLQE